MSRFRASLLAAAILSTLTATNLPRIREAEPRAQPGPPPRPKPAPRDFEPPVPKYKRRATERRAQWKRERNGRGKR